MSIKPVHLFLILVVNLSFGQNAVKGTISDNQSLPLPFANVILFEEGDDNPVKGVVSSDEGKYQFENIANGNYFIEVSVLGFKVEKSEIFKVSDADEILNFSLKEEAQELNEVVVKGNRPVIKQTADKLIVNLENSEMVNNNLQDVVKKVPGIIMTNGKVSYAGQGNIRILINGKTTDYMDTETLLRDFPADNISKVELIQQPGAEYDAEGSGPILNIILKKNVKLGTHGNIRATLGYVDDFMYRTNASVASYKNKLNWQASAGYGRSSWRDDLILSRSVLDETYNQTSISPFDPETINLSGGLDYYLSSEHTIGASARHIENTSDRVTENVTELINSAGTSRLSTDNRFDRERTTFTLNPYYEFKNEKNRFTLDYNYVSYSYHNENNLIQVGESTIPYTNQRYFQEADYAINTYKWDYKRTANDNFSWSIGMKFADVTSDSDLESLLQNNGGVFEVDAAQSNRFIIDETILAVYSQTSLKLDNWTFKGGLRWEESDTKGRSITTDETRTRKIAKFFPSASVSRKITDEVSANLAYSYRIQRPAYSSLNSFVYFYDPYTFEEGNPNLKPAFTDSYQFSLTYENQPFFNINYRETSDALFEIIQQDDATAQTSRSVINLASNKNWSFSLFAPINFVKGLDGFTGIIANHNQFESALLTPKLDLSKWSITWYTSAEYQLPWDINSEISGYYTSGGLEGIIEYEWVAGLDIAISKKFLKDRLKVSLEYEEIIERTFNGIVKYDNVNADIVSDFPRHNVYLQLNYSFGSKFGKEKNRKNASEDEQDRIELEN